MQYNKYASAIPIIVKAVLACNGWRGVEDHARALACDDILIPTIQKAAVSAFSSRDNAAGEDFTLLAQADNAFFETMQGASIFFRLLASGGREVPFYSRIGSRTGAIKGGILLPGQSIPVSTLGLSMSSLKPETAAAIIVVTDDVAKSVDKAASRFVTDELRDAVRLVVDAQFLDIITGDDTLRIPSSPTAFSEALDHVNGKADGSLIWAVAPNAANRLAVDPDHENMTPLGGELFGLPAMVTDAVPSGSIILMNAFGIAVAAERVEIESSGETSLVMDDAPAMNSATPASATLVSLWQTNSRAVKVSVRFAARRLRDNAVAVIEGFGA
ncbi:hypothetical protein [Aureimonas altamirensis]|uniref:hypothetical protein n=1 Tax=Aureimonas altamirensis TaxID=370622 RepID=UPI00255340EF|nr:hypothetical protein [Aureimonas altamirensis]